MRSILVALEKVDEWLRESPIREIQMASAACGIDAPTVDVRAAIALARGDIRKEKVVKPDNKFGQRNEWAVGDAAFFEYQCQQSHDSADAELWYRSHQPITVIDDSEELYDPAPDLNTLAKRRDQGQPRCYTVRFSDGFEGTAKECELYVSPQYFDTSGAPPSQDEIALAQRVARRAVGACFVVCPTDPMSAADAIADGVFSIVGDDWPERVQAFRRAAIAAAKGEA